MFTSCLLVVGAMLEHADSNVAVARANRWGLFIERYSLMLVVEGGLGCFGCLYDDHHLSFARFKTVGVGNLQVASQHDCKQH